MSSSVRRVMKLSSVIVGSVTAFIGVAVAVAAGAEVAVGLAVALGVGAALEHAAVAAIPTATANIVINHFLIVSSSPATG